MTNLGARDIAMALDRADKAIAGQEQNVKHAQTGYGVSVETESWALSILRAQVCEILGPLGYVLPELRGK